MTNWRYGIVEFCPKIGRSIIFWGIIEAVLTIPILPMLSSVQVKSMRGGVALSVLSKHVRLQALLSLNLNTMVVDYGLPSFSAKNIKKVKVQLKVDQKSDQKKKKKNGKRL